MDARRFPQAVEAFHRAVEKFSQQSTVGLAGMFGPHPDMADAWFRLGNAQFEAKDYTSAITSLDHASKLRPEDSRAIFVRARAREMLGQSGLADYDLASRTAFANVNAPGAGGQAHLYRGLAYYRRGDYARAEQEFSSSLNFDSGWAKDDAIAWRHMAALAGGACGPSAAMLRESLGRVRGYRSRAPVFDQVRYVPPDTRRAGTEPFKASKPVVSASKTISRMIGTGTLPQV